MTQCALAPLLRPISTENGAVAQNRECVSPLAENVCSCAPALDRECLRPSSPRAQCVVAACAGGAVPCKCAALERARAAQLRDRTSSLHQQR
mmetsp:Transcript_18307/g.59940  ORF Transcript_18307/g.59940 Transcript_18307/m.59940 type:complete len:92 (-) Transcript_18307:578-853(-)|eukprot:scaffold7371_cov121-Isochrysis_galbana.AAC.9